MQLFYPGILFLHSNYLSTKLMLSSKVNVENYAVLLI